MEYAKYASWFKVLSDETRLTILCRLADQELCACDLLEEFGVSQSTLSYHMKLLTTAELVEFRRDGNKKMYALKNKNLEELHTFIGLVSKGANTKLTI